MGIRVPNARTRVAAVPGSARNRVLRGNSGHRGGALIPAVPGMEFPWGFTAFWGWCSFRSVPAAPGVEFSWGFTGDWERGLFCAYRCRAKGSLPGGLGEALADSVIFATFRPKPCLAGGFLRIRGFSVILRGSPGAERCARDLSGPRIFFFGGRVLLAGPRSPEKVAECAPGSARKGGKRVAPVHSGAKIGCFSVVFTPHG